MKGSQAAEAGEVGNFGHRELRLIDQLFCALDTGRAGRRGRCCAKVLVKEPRQLARTHTKPVRKIIHTLVVQSPFRDEPERPGNGCPRTVPGRRMWRGFGTASQARSETGILGRRCAWKVAHIPT